MNDPTARSNAGSKGVAETPVVALAPASAAAPPATPSCGSPPAPPLYQSEPTKSGSITLDSSSSVYSTNADSVSGPGEQNKFSLAFPLFGVEGGNFEPNHAVSIMTKEVKSFLEAHVNPSLRLVCLAPPGSFALAALTEQVQREGWGRIWGEEHLERRGAAGAGEEIPDASLLRFVVMAGTVMDAMVLENGGVGHSCRR